MNNFWRPSSWKGCLAFTIAVLLVLIVTNFYGLYTNKFYLFKVDNYIFPLLTIVHFFYLSTLQFRITNNQLIDSQLRNLEFGLYAILLVYIFKATDTAYILLSYWEYDPLFIPETFLPFGLTILSLQLALITLTVMSFRYRKELLGRYNFDQVNDKLDSWQ